MDLFQTCGDTVRPQSDRNVILSGYDSRVMIFKSLWARKPPSNVRSVLPHEQNRTVGCRFLCRTDTGSGAELMSDEVDKNGLNISSK